MIRYIYTYTHIYVANFVFVISRRSSQNMNEIQYVSSCILGFLIFFYFKYRATSLNLPGRKTWSYVRANSHSQSLEIKNVFRTVYRSSEVFWNSSRNGKCFRNIFVSFNVSSSTKPSQFRHHTSVRFQEDLYVISRIS